MCTKVPEPSVAHNGRKSERLSDSFLMNLFGFHYCLLRTLLYPFEYQKQPSKNGMAEKSDEKNANGTHNANHIIMAFV